MSGYRQLEVSFEDQNPQKWCVPLKEDVFAKFMEDNNNAAVKKKVFGRGSLFSPFLFGKFFDPSDAFPLWEFDCDVLLASLRSSDHCTVDWLQNETDYVLKAQLPGVVEVSIENGKVIEISGVWRQQQQQQREGWRSREWWEEGFVRRIEIPENTDSRKTETSLYNNDTFLQIRVPKASPN